MTKIDQVAKIEVIEAKNFAGEVADELVSLIGEAILERGICRIALSGGTTPGGVYRSLGHPPRVGDVAWDKLVLAWGDERYVSHDDPQSNFNMVKGNMLSGLVSKPRLLPIPTHFPTAEEAAIDYQALLKDEFGGEEPIFDIVLLGLGDDGHTASLFPNSSLVTEISERLVAATTNPKDGTTRITMMPKLLMRGRRIMFLVSGQSKADIVYKVYKGIGTVEQHPANLFKDVAGKVTWYLDSGAAKRLQESAS
jgi:6-phosphogluconolactonase